LEKERRAEKARQQQLAERRRRKEFEALLKAAENASDVFELGERISHWNYGEGMVVAMDGPRITIDFDDPEAGQKTADHFRYFERATPVAATEPKFEGASP
jgi:hypothetical protein